MKLMRKIFSFYYNSRYIPFLLAILPFLLIILFFFVYTYLLNEDLSATSFEISAFFFAVWFGSILCYTTHIFYSLLKKRWFLMGVELLVLCPIGILYAYSILFFCVIGLFVSEDNFAKDIEIPADAQYEEPLERGESSIFDGIKIYRTGKNLFQDKVVDALIDDNNKGEFSLKINSLEKFSKENPDLLKRYLASSSEWFLNQEYQGVFAKRRWLMNGDVYQCMHNNYSSYEGENDMQSFQYRCLLGPYKKSSYWKASKNKPEKDINGDYSLFTFFNAGNVSVEIIEANKVNASRMTAKTVEVLEDEFAKILNCKNFDEVKKLLPEHSFKIGKPEFILKNGEGGKGIYTAEIWVNPGEEGYIYLKAFETTKNISLSEPRLKEDTNEYIGYSDDANEVYSSFVNFTIYEGDWGDYYLARFEVWFVSSKSGQERKLMEKVFKIEGWQR